jgi:hypothetical protein
MNQSEMSGDSSSKVVSRRRGSPREVSRRVLTPDEYRKILDRQPQDNPCYLETSSRTVTRSVRGEPRITSSERSNTKSETREFVNSEYCRECVEPTITITRGEPRVVSISPDKSRSTSTRKVYGEDQVIAINRYPKRQVTFTKKPKNQPQPEQSKTVKMENQEISEQRKHDILQNCGQVQLNECDLQFYSTLSDFGHVQSMKQAITHCHEYEDWKQDIHHPKPAPRLPPTEPKSHSKRVSFTLADKKEDIAEFQKTETIYDLVCRDLSFNQTSNSKISHQIASNHQHQHTIDLTNRALQRDIQSLKNQKSINPSQIIGTKIDVSTPITCHSSCHPPTHAPTSFHPQIISFTKNIGLTPPTTLHKKHIKTHNSLSKTLKKAQKPKLKQEYHTEKLAKLAQRRHLYAQYTHVDMAIKDKICREIKVGAKNWQKNQ